MKQKFNTQLITFVKKYSLFGKKAIGDRVIHHEWIYVSKTINDFILLTIKEQVKQGKNVKLITGYGLSESVKEDLLNLMVEPLAKDKKKIKLTRWVAYSFMILFMVSILITPFGFPINDDNTMVRFFLPLLLIYLTMEISDLYTRKVLLNSMQNTHFQMIVLNRSQFQSDYVVECIDYENVAIDGIEIADYGCSEDFEALIEQCHQLVAKKEGLSQDKLLTWLYKGE